MSSKFYVDLRDPELVIMHRGNENSGRYRKGSGERPYQHDHVMREMFSKYVAEDPNRKYAAKKETYIRSLGDVSPLKNITLRQLKTKNIPDFINIAREDGKTTVTANNASQKRMLEKLARLQYNGWFDEKHNFDNVLSIDIKRKDVPKNSLYGLLSDGMDKKYVRITSGHKTGRPHTTSDGNAFTYMEDITSREKRRILNSK